MIDVVHGKEQRVVVAFGPAAELAATIGQYSQKVDAFPLEHRQDAII